MTVNITLTDAWQRGVAAAKAQTAAALNETKVEVPVSRTWAALPILASPHIHTWPVDVREWLFDKCGITELNDEPSRFCAGPVRPGSFSAGQCGLTAAPGGDLCWIHRYEADSE